MEPTNKEVSRQLGALLGELRKAIGLKQEELATKINASRSFIAQVETGRMNLPASRIREITDALLEYIGEIRITEVDPTLVIALKRLKRAVSSVEDIPEEHAKHDAFIAFYETVRIFTRLFEMLISGDKHPTAISVPLIGLLLLFPEAETHLLIHLLGPIPYQDNTDKLRFEIFVNDYIVRALCSANQMLEYMTDQPSIIVGLARESLTSDENQLQKVALLRRMHTALSQDSPVRKFIEALLSELPSSSA